MLWPTTARFCCQPQRRVVAPVLEELLLDERAVRVVLEVLLDVVEGAFQEVRVLRIAGREPQVDQIGGRVVADGVPVLARLVLLEDVRTRVERPRVDVREVAALFAIDIELVEQVDRQSRVVEDLRIARGAVGLDGAGQRIDLLVGGDGVEVVAELRREQLLLAGPVDLDAVVPVDQLLVGVVEAHVVAEVLRASLGALQEPILAGQQVGGRESVDQAGDGVRLLQVVAALGSAQMQERAVLAEVDRLLGVAELPAQVAVGDGAHLVDPPVRLLVSIVAWLFARKDEALDLEPRARRWSDRRRRRQRRTGPLRASRQCGRCSPGTAPPGSARCARTHSGSGSPRNLDHRTSAGRRSFSARLKCVTYPAMRSENVNASSFTRVLVVSELSAGNSLELVRVFVFREPSRASRVALRGLAWC